MSQHKIDLTIAGSFTAWSATFGTLTFLEKLQAGQIIVTTTVSVLGGCWMLWKWRKDICRHRRRDRRRDDPPDDC